MKNNGLCGEQGKELDNEMFRAAFRCEQLEHELKKICGTLEKARIPFIPLKGSVLRRYYPEPWMRTSCDIDVFVREADLDRAIEALWENLSYRIGEISDHDVQIYTPNGQHIELHRNLIEDHRINQAQRCWRQCGIPQFRTAAGHTGWKCRTSCSISTTSHIRRPKGKAHRGVMKAVGETTEQEACPVTRRR